MSRDDVDDSAAAEFMNAVDDDDGRTGGDAAASHSRQAAISRGRWVLLAVNVALLVACVALMTSTALGWRVRIAGAANASSLASPTAAATTPSSVIPTTGSGLALPTPTATTTPTPARSGPGGGAAPTATPPPPRPTVAPTPTPEPTIGSVG